MKSSKGKPTSLATGDIGRLRLLLLDWYRKSKRDLPWRRSRDPYRIWLSEIMLQQTRVAAVIPYYDRFLKKFPTMEKLAAARESTVLGAWSGLGYYSRARNLLKAARDIAARGKFPGAYEEIRALAGVGDYTAAAVASIAFNLPHVAVDGNVLRVMSRMLAESADIDSQVTRARLKGEAFALLDPRHPGAFNQAMMELGATVCLPRDPRCPECPWARDCRAHRLGVEHKLPVKLRKEEPVRLHRTVLRIERNGQLLLWQRPPDASRMAGFWELPEKRQLPGAQPGRRLGRFRHSITRYNYTVTVVESAVARTPSGFCWVDQSRLESIPLSTVARKALACAGRASSC